MNMVTAVGAARPAQHIPEYYDAAALQLARTDWGRASYATEVESSTRPSLLAAGGMAATETPLAGRDDGDARRRLLIMEDVAAKLNKLAETSRSDLAARSLEALRQKLRLLKMQALGAIMRNDRRAAQILAEELADLARAIVAAERDYANAGGLPGAPTSLSLPTLRATPRGEVEPPVMGEAAADIAAANRRHSPEGGAGGEISAVLTAIAGMKAATGEPVPPTTQPAAAVAATAAPLPTRDAAGDTTREAAVTVRRGSTLLPLFDTSDGVDGLADEAASLIRALRRAATRPGKGRSTSVGAQVDAAAIAGSLGIAGLFGMAAATPTATLA